MTLQKVLVFFLTIMASCLAAQDKINVDETAILELINQYTTEEDPGVAVGIVQNGQNIYEKYMGYANLDHYVKVTPQTRFNIASNAKQYTALCILKLVREGKVNLDDDFRKYLPDYYPNILDKITIRNLITHRSGVRDYCDLLALRGKTWWKQFIDNDDALEMIKDQEDLNFTPDSQFLYSNSNYTLLTEIVKEVTGKEFNEYAVELFQSMGMNNTKFQTHYGEIIPNRARPYGNWGQWRDEATITEVHGDGALYTTLQDQMKWEQIVQNNNGQYISQEILNESQSALNGSIESGHGYGLNLKIEDGIEYRYHEGATSAYSAMFIRFPEKNFSVIVMTNNRNVSSYSLAWQIAGLYLDFESSTTEYPGNPKNTEAVTNINELLGYYKSVDSNDGTVIKISEKDGELYREIYQRDPVKLMHESNGLYEYETIKDLKLNFENIGKPNQQFTLYKATQKPQSFVKKSDLSFNNFDKSEMNGRYYNAENDTEIILKHIEGDNYSLTKNGREREAFLILEDYVRMMSSYKIRAIRDKEDNIIGLSVDNNRIQNVIFTKTYAD